MSWITLKEEKNGLGVSRWKKYISTYKKNLLSGFFVAAAAVVVTLKSVSMLEARAGKKNVENNSRTTPICEASSLIICECEERYWRKHFIRVIAIYSSQSFLIYSYPICFFFRCSNSLCLPAHNIPLQFFCCCCKHRSHFTSASQNRCGSWSIFEECVWVCALRYILLILFSISFSVSLRD